jgi:hypothetical protein
MCRQISEIASHERLFGHQAVHMKVDKVKVSVAEAKDFTNCIERVFMTDSC